MYRRQYRRHNDILFEDLQRLPENVFAVKHITEELETLELESKALKATNYDKLPSGSGGNSQRDKIEENLYRKEVLTLALKATESKVADMERLLSELSSEDRMLIDTLVINRNKTTEQVAEEIGLQSRQVLNRKNEALEKLKRLRFGEGYQP